MLNLFRICVVDQNDSSGVNERIKIMRLRSKKLLINYCLHSYTYKLKVRHIQCRT